MEFLKKLFSPVTGTLDFIQKYFKSLIFILILVLIFGSRADEAQIHKPNLAKIYLYGPIMDAAPFLEDLDQIDQDNIQGIMLVVDSPGGLIAPSVEIAEAIKEIASRKKVVAYAAGTMASGSYYASIWSDTIVANPGSMLGSIGVIFNGTNIEEVMEKVGIKPQTVQAGKYKLTGTFFRTWEPHEKAELEKVVQAQYDMFVNDVASARGLKPENHIVFADAHIFTSIQAKEVGLIDRVGTLSLAEKELLVLTGIENPIWQKEDQFEKYFKQIMSESMTQAATNLIRLFNY